MEPRTEWEIPGFAPGEKISETRKNKCIFDLLEIHKKRIEMYRQDQEILYGIIDKLEEIIEELVRENCTTQQCNGISSPSL